MPRTEQVSFNMKKRDFELIQTLTNMKKVGEKTPLDSQNEMDSEEHEVINVIN